MRHQPSYQVPRTTPDDVVVASPVRTARVEVDDEAVLVDRGTDGAELEIKPTRTTRGARWTRTETLLGLGLVVVLFGGAAINTLGDLAKGGLNASPTPVSSGAPNVAPPQLLCTTIKDNAEPSRARIKVNGKGAWIDGETGAVAGTDSNQPDDWDVPETDETIEIGLGTPLQAGSGGTCVTGWSVWVMPTSDVSSGVGLTMVHLGSTSFEATSASYEVPGPTADGDWVLRLSTAYPTDTGGLKWSVKFFRVIVAGEPFSTPPPPTPRPTAVPTPAITPTVACVAPATNSGPPGVNLVAPGQEPVPGVIGAFTWFSAETLPDQVELTEGPKLPFEGDVVFEIAGDICATRWSITSMAWQEPSTTVFTELSFGVGAEWASFNSNRQDNPYIAQQNRIPSKTVGLGKVIVRAILYFEGGNKEQVYWLLRLDAFGAPPIRIVGADGASVGTVQGCGVSISTNEAWWGEECPNGTWVPVGEDVMLTVRANDIVTIESPSWSIQYWGLNWAESSEVHAGSDPPFVGSFGGQDTLEPEVIRWLPPPPGDWTVQLYLTHQEGDRSYTTNLLFRLRVLP